MLTSEEVWNAYLKKSLHIYIRRGLECVFDQEFTYLCQKRFEIYAFGGGDSSVVRAPDS